MRASDRFSVQGVSCQLGGQRLPVANLSVGGFFVASRLAAPPPGQSFQIQLQLEDRVRPLTLVGRVAWRNEPSQARAAGTPAGFGVQITRIGLGEKLALLDWLRRQSASETLRPR